MEVLIEVAAFQIGKNSEEFAVAVIWVTPDDQLVAMFGDVVDGDEPPINGWRYVATTGVDPDKAVYFETMEEFVASRADQEDDGSCPACGAGFDQTNMHGSQSTFCGHCSAIY
jgi:hypothetical protein